MKASMIIIAVMFLSIPCAWLNAQSWQQNDQIFNPSGVPSLPFSQPRFADLDADNDFDMTLGTTEDHPVYLENTGTVPNPSFQAGPDIFSSVSPLDAEMGVFHDLDDDDDLDFICGGFTGLNYFENIGNVTQPILLKVENFFQGLSVGSYPVPTLADLDSDGDPDLLVGLSESGLLKYYENEGTPGAAAFLESHAQNWYDVGLYAYPYLADLDNDGDFDLLVGKDGHGFDFYRNVGDPSQWQWQPDHSVFTGLAQTTYWNSPCLVDLNGDGKNDLVYGTSAGPLNYFMNTGTAAVPVWTKNNDLFGGVLDVGGASSPFLFDFDDDGDLDLLSGSQLGSVKYYENTGSASWPAWQEASSYFSSIKHSIYSAVTAGDVDGNSLPDIIAGDLSGQLFYHQNMGTGFRYIATMFSGVDVGDWSAPVLVDMDNDDDLDLVVGNENGHLIYFENTGSPMSPDWNEIPGYFGGIDVGSNCSPSAGDLDRDGNVDIVTGDLFGEVQCFKHQAGSWKENPAAVSGISGDQNTAPALGDLDSDGDLDLALGNYGGTFNYFKNRRGPLLPETNLDLFR